MRRLYTQLALLALVLALLWPALARAHAQGVSLGEYRISGSEIRGRVVLRAEEAALVLGPVDTNHDGTLSATEVAAGSPHIDAAIVQRLRWFADGAPCSAKLSRAELEAPDGLAVEFLARCQAPPQRQLRLDAQLLDLLPAGHLHRASMYIAGNKSDTLLVLARREYTLELDAATATANAQSAANAAQQLLAGGYANSQRTRSDWGALVREGIAHILSGADHLAFLFALLLLPTRNHADPKYPALRKFALVLSAFTVGHTAALAIATLAGIAPSPRIVEPLVALSVAIVGIEALRGHGRWQALITLPFGLIHGFAFASGLLPLGLARQDLPRAVLGFNIGVELGQFLVVGAALPALMLLRRSAQAPRIERYAAHATVAAGTAWFVARVLGFGI